MTDNDDVVYLSPLRGVHIDPSDWSAWNKVKFDLIDAKRKVVNSRRYNQAGISKRLILDRKCKNKHLGRWGYIA